jgi:Ca2+/Na+ antiporter
MTTRKLSTANNMTLLIALLLLSHMGQLNWWTAILTVFLWLVHLITRVGSSN